MNRRLHAVQLCFAIALQIRLKPTRVVDAVWEASRSGFLEGLKVLDPDTVKQGWQKDYFRGKTEQGTFEPHQTRVDLKEFE